MTLRDLQDRIEGTARQFGMDELLSELMASIVIEHVIEYEEQKSLAK